MKNELTPSEVIFKCSFKELSDKERLAELPQVTSRLNDIKRALKIKKNGYNLYYIDSFAMDKLSDLKDYISEIYEEESAPKDICYVITEDVLNPKVLFLPSGKGTLLKERIDDVKNQYFDCVIEFYNGSSDKEKEDLLEETKDQRNEYISKLMKKAKENNFDVKATNGGFVFIPLKSQGNEMTEDEYDELENHEQGEIKEQVSELKKEAQVVLDKLTALEIKSINELRVVYEKYLKKEMKEVKEDLLFEFVTDKFTCMYLSQMFDWIEEQIVECYTVSLEEDQQYIDDIFTKFEVRVLVDNKNTLHPRVIFEEDPTINNLIGNIEYKNSNGGYLPDIELIHPGSLLKANEGCLILNLNSLLASGYSYYYLKKILMFGKIDYSYTKNYLDVLSLEGLKPESIPINVKVILIGDYEAFSILHERDEEFKRIFPLKVEMENQLKCNDASRSLVADYIKNKVKSENLLDMDQESIEEIFKYLSRIIGDRTKISVDNYYIDRILYLANDKANSEGRFSIIRDDIISSYHCDDKDIKEEMLDSYKNNKVLISIKGEKIGSINGLAVIGTSLFSLGRPMRITCLAFQGSGRIIDVHNECKLSGNIHEKSIVILRGLINSLLSPYESLPVDFQLSFEQTYSLIEGDSASVAEIICMLSAISKKPIKQNIAVTGSINQFGEVQPIGMVNEKIEGFYTVCKTLDNVSGKGVLIPSMNKDELILEKEVEESISSGDFHIYTMDTLEDAIEVLILNEGENVKTFFKIIEEEITKYKPNKKKK
ncbi:ATP-dependent protease [Clostridium botulinum]|uniref:endopeptidase La n=1 Tax=Clostridium botulinum TaxID=1491 RepID=A0A0L9YAJ3_CLOBO|nr:MULTISPECIES: AAA family ATPase [Clostridium]KAI3350463.1 AAA family ATPase [Clostridium botulinum]KOM88484.1 ATP-dependent protease [Clostridium botulinum]KOR55142.1 ATP-dependent protease [Clostridium botulinum]MBN1034681.1 ATP-dependent protease [Clostridium botulinum]MBN1041227.1 ATP-dependent protease [Clostridium botulinum]